MRGSTTLSSTACPKPNCWNVRPDTPLGTVAVVLLVLLPSLPAMSKTIQWKLQPGKQYQLNVRRVTERQFLKSRWKETIQYRLLWEVEGLSTDDAVEATPQRVRQTLDQVVHSMTFDDGITFLFDSASGDTMRDEAAVLANLWRQPLRSTWTFDLTGRGPTPVTSVPPNNATATSSATSVPVGELAELTKQGDDRPASLATPRPANTDSERPPNDDNAVAPAGATSESGTAATGAVRGKSDLVPRNWAEDSLFRPLRWLLPEAGIEPGAEWENAESLAWRATPDALQLKVTYEYVGTDTIDEKPLERFKVNVQIEKLNAPESLKRIEFERQAGGGTILFDADRGQLVRFERDQTLVSRLLKPDGNSEQVEIETSIQVDFSPVADASTDTAASTP